MAGKMTEAKLEEVLKDLLEEVADGLDGIRHDLPVARVSTFDEAGVLTRNAGLVLRLADGTKFQLTIVEDRR